MARPGDELVDPSGVRLRFAETAGSSGEHGIVLDWHLPPGTRLVAVPHVHPGDVERFEVVAGRARYRVARHVHERAAPHAYGVPAGAIHVHAANAGDGELHVRQSVRRRAPSTALFEGVERYFETVFALSQQGRLDRRGWIVDPLQSALTISELIMPFSYLPWLPHGAQDALLGRLADAARGLGYTAHLEPDRAVRGEASPAVPSMA
jgi:hypothetical protein